MKVDIPMRNKVPLVWWTRVWWTQVCLGMGGAVAGIVPVAAQPAVPLALPAKPPMPKLSQLVDPTRDRSLPPSVAPVPLPVEGTSPLTVPAVPAPPAPTAPEESSIIQFPIRRIEVTGSHIFSRKDWELWTAPLEGKSVSLEDLRRVTDQITQLYLNRGYVTSRAVLVDQTITDGVVQIQVIEGALERIDIQGTQRLRSYITQRINAGQPLSRDAIEDQLRLLKADPLFTNVEASLRPSQILGQSILVVRVAEARAWSGFVGADNYSPPSVGSNRLGAGLNYRNLAVAGDALAVAYFRTTTDSSNAFDLSYRVPVNAMNGTVQLRLAPNTNRVVDPRFDDLGIRGNSEFYELSYRQPLVRSPRTEFALSMALAVQDGQTFLFDNLAFPFGAGAEADGSTKTRVLKFGQDYVKREPQGAWSLRSQVSLGLNIFDATINDSPTPDGRFISWLGQVQRVQRLGIAHVLIAQADLQLTPDSLLSAQQFVIGGGQSVRGFRQNAKSGDNGFRLSLEDRITVQRDASGVPVVQVAPFLDLGAVWNNRGNLDIRQGFLAGGGLGLLWQPIAGLNIRLDYAIPFVELRDRGEDAQDKAFYFSVMAAF
jgi:hemolysin activation/secretion protein